MARYQVRDASLKKINVIEWDGQADLGTQYADCSITPDDGSPLWAVPPVTVTRRQMMLALNAQGKLAEINAIVANADIVVQLSWAEATTFDRNDPIIVTMGAANNWTEQNLDDLFTLASSY